MNAFLISLLLAVAPATDPAAESAPPLPAPLASLGLRTGMDYAPVRSALLQHGWTAEPHDYDGAPPIARYPEVDCGQGWQAVCSVGYRKGDNVVYLAMDPAADGHLRLLGAE